MSDEIRGLRPLSGLSIHWSLDEVYRAVERARDLRLNLLRQVQDETLRSGQTPKHISMLDSALGG